MRKPNNKLSEREKTIYNFLTANKSNVLSIPIDNICKELKVGYATIYSLIKKLGFTRYRELVLHIYNETVDVTSPDHQNLKIAYNSLVEINFEKQNDIKIQTIVNFLKSQKQVFILGKSNSHILAQKYTFDFNRLGIRAFTLADDYDSLMLQAALMNQGDLLFIVSNSGRTESILDATRIILEKQVPIITICADNNPWLEAHSTVFYRLYNRNYINSGERVSNFLPFLTFLDLLWSRFDQ